MDSHLVAMQSPYPISCLISGPEILQCRFCLGDEPGDALERGVLISPCDCKALVHPSCLKKWQGHQVGLTKEEGAVSGCRRCEVCHAYWTVELISDAERVLKARCWVREISRHSFTNAGDHSHELWWGETTKALREAICPGTLIIQRPARAHERALSQHGCQLIIHTGQSGASGSGAAVRGGPLRGPIVAFNLARRLLPPGVTETGTTETAAEYASTAQHSPPAWCSSEKVDEADGGVLESGVLSHVVLNGGPFYEDQHLAAMAVECPDASIARASASASPTGSRPRRALSALMEAPSLLPVQLGGGVTLLIGDPQVVAAAAAVASAAGLVPTASRLIVGVAVWTVDQLMAELSVGNWGLCKACAADLQLNEADLWRGSWARRGLPLIAGTSTELLSELW